MTDLIILEVQVHVTAFIIALLLYIILSSVYYIISGILFFLT